MGPDITNCNRDVGFVPKAGHSWLAVSAWRRTKMLYLITKALISGVIKMLASEAAKRSPRGRTNLTMRIYSPKADASGKWNQRPAMKA